MLLWVGMLIGCGDQGAVDPGDTVQQYSTVDTGWRLEVPEQGVQTVAQYAEECAEFLGPIPSIDCVEDGVPVMITQDGEPVSRPVAECDSASSLFGMCNPYARVGWIPSRYPDGRVMPGAGFAFVCRTNTTWPLDEYSVMYNIVAMIGHDPRSGATCFFQAEYTRDHTYKFPTPADPANADVWEAPAVVAAQGCDDCHSSDPIVHTPWIDSAKKPGTDEPMLPNLHAPNTPYRVLGADFADWKLEHFDIEDNACTSCHRVGGAECGVLVDAIKGKGLGGMSFMPPVGVPNSQRMKDDAKQLLNCCENPDLPECNRTTVPSGL